MKAIVDNKKHIIEFKHIIGQDMIEEIKQLFYFMILNHLYITQLKEQGLWS
ncbi:hypothetical protein [Clostridium botulinum]|uniref:hypothetical protein n=1 Tax=Clostridium botulinum TaxID=1491 RepID=UPI001FAC36FC|nr:hypothetical protein [Clostridium botulinum]